MRICILSGSTRPNNNTLRVAKALQKLAEKEHAVTLIDFQQFDLPYYHQGSLREDQYTSFQKELFQALSEAHIIWTVSPEYNWSTTPELLHLFNLMSNKPLNQFLQNKVFAFVGVSTGKGGKAPCLHLMQIAQKLIGFNDAESIVSARIFESHFTKEVIDENGNLLGNELYNKGIEAFISYSVRIADRWFR